MTRDLAAARAARQAKRDASPAAPGIGQRVRDRRVAAGMDHVTLAAASGVSRETVRTVETMSRASLQTLRRLADALECQWTDLAT